MGALLSEVRRVAELNARVDPLVKAQDDGGMGKETCGLVQKMVYPENLLLYHLFL